MLLPCSCFRFTSRKLRVSPTSHRHYCATTVIMSSWLDGMGRQEARFQPGDRACLVTWKSSFFPLYQLHSEILEKLEQAIVFRKGSSICMKKVQGSASVHSCEQRRLSGKTLHRGNCRLVQSRNSHFLSAAVDRASALGSAGARAHEEPDMCHQRVQVEALSVAVCGV